MWMILNLFVCCFRVSGCFFFSPFLWCFFFSSIIWLRPDVTSKNHVYRLVVVVPVMEWIFFFHVWCSWNTFFFFLSLRSSKLIENKTYKMVFLIGKKPKNELVLCPFMNEFFFLNKVINFAGCFISLFHQSLFFWLKITRNINRIQTSFILFIYLLTFGSQMNLQNKNKKNLNYIHYKPN